MKINYDPKKNEKNIRKRGLSFDRASELDFATASYFLRERGGEVRRIVVGYLDKRLHVLVYQYRDGGMWVISFEKRARRRQNDMAKQKPLIDADGEVSELTAADFKRMKPFSALPKAEQAMLRKMGRPKSEKPKELVTVRLDADVLAFLRADGAGWQTRMNALLADAAKRVKKSKGRATR